MIAERGKEEESMTNNFPGTALEPSRAARAKTSIWSVVLGVYALSFFLPTVEDGNEHCVSQLIPRSNSLLVRSERIRLGWEVFYLVPRFLPFSLGYLPAWVANVVLWHGLVALARDRWVRARTAAWLGVPLGLSALLVAPYDRGWLTILMGYYVWLLSMVLFLVGIEVLRRWAATARNRERCP